MISNTLSVVEAAVPVTIVPLIVSLLELPVTVSTPEVSVLVKMLYSYIKLGLDYTL